MISYIEGKIITKNIDSLIINTSGVGYKVFINNILSYKVGDNISLLIHHSIKEDQMNLFGFEKKEVIDIFELLIKVSGIGPKLAMQMLSNSSDLLIREWINSDNVNELSKIPGIGKKTAQKIIVELKTKLVVDFNNKDMEDSIIKSLTAIGYKKNDIKKELKNIVSSESEEIILSKLIKRLGR